VRKRKLVDEVRGDWNVSIRRACRVLLFDTSSYHYKSRRPGQAVLEQRIKEICQTRVRYGYRRVHVLLCREGWRINHKKTYRIDVLPGMTSFRGRVCSGYAPGWGVLQTPLV
jgi:putative transposase